MLGRWSAGSGPLYARLAEALRTAIARGDIPPDTRLPAERQLAKSLNVSRSTVVSAYDVLYSEGLVSRRRGSGTWVEPQQAAQVRRSHMHQVWVPQAALRTIVDDPGNAIPFTASTVDRLTDGLPQEVFNLTGAEVLHHRLYFEIPEGLPELRAAVAALYDEAGLPTETEQIVITAGAQEAIALVATAHLSRGDLAIIESPTYPGAIDALSLCGAVLRGVRVDRNGADVESIERTAAQSHVGLMYLTPTFHNPTGTLMPSSQRESLGRVIDRWNIPVIDDGSLMWLSHGTSVPPPLAAFAQQAPVYSVGSMSKLFWGGIRIGWVRCPIEGVGPILRLKSINDLSCSIPSQVIAFKMLAHRDEMIELRRSQFLERVELYERLLVELVPSWTYERPAGGVSLWVDTGVDAEVLAQVALRHGVALVTGSSTSVDSSSRSSIRLPIGLEMEMIETGMRRLATAWRTVASGGSHPDGKALVI